MHEEIGLILSCMQNGRETGWFFEILGEKEKRRKIFQKLQLQRTHILERERAGTKVTYF